MRLDKLIEISYQTSRSETKQLLKSRQVFVDGKSELSGSRNVDSQLHKIEVLGKGCPQTQHVYYLLNKPRGVVTTVYDAEKETVLDLLAAADKRENIYPVGRLDRDTEGLVFLTDNGPLGYALMQAKFQVAKIYEAQINAEVTAADIAAFAEGIVFADGTRCQPAKLEILAACADESQVRLEIVEGKFHQVKKMFLACGKKVTALKRLQLGPLKLPADLAVGAYRPLNEAELMTLLPFF
ncbi:16S rRNA pseudouridine516 synthase [Enterococcus sp. PF1-24]|uniref:16S rRNA pseudouridine(516) synthase n=1 Tax=unclassified Enterococcus TaxID=2608891 RepID=UPI002476564A|nr:MULTISPECIES: 16S rRNA pseudouridine(516) synthase [unclassified Enterococcus]MDH6364869.1 16S rRNA pseudouridine516 synthase [Enterococcus sp. PFB1-1]MDH6401970.1 16S rRNA pseudouridine516 synthase [Enterococcus sp. PF1-24]